MQPIGPPVLTSGEPVRGAKQNPRQSFQFPLEEVLRLIESTTELAGRICARVADLRESALAAHRGDAAQTILDRSHALALIVYSSLGKTNDSARDLFFA